MSFFYYCSDYYLLNQDTATDYSFKAPLMKLSIVLPPPTVSVYFFRDDQIAGYLKKERETDREKGKQTA